MIDVHLHVDNVDEQDEVIGKQFKIAWCKMSKSDRGGFTLDVFERSPTRQTTGRGKKKVCAWVVCMRLVYVCMCLVYLLFLQLILFLFFSPLLLLFFFYVLQEKGALQFANQRKQEDQVFVG